MKPADAGREPPRKGNGGEANANSEESERQLRTLADSIPNLAWMAEADGYIFWYNQRWYEYTGTTPEQMQGWGWQSVHDPAMLPNVLDRWQASIRTGASFEMQFPLRGAGGEFRWFLTRVTPVRDAQGAVIRWFGTNTDVHDLRSAEEERQRLLALEQEARRTAELLNSVGPLLARELDLSRLVQAVTDLATKLVGAQFGACFHNVTNESGESYLLYTLSGAPPEAFANFPMPRNTAVFGPTFRGEGIVRSDDITKDRRYGKSAPHHGMPNGHLPVKSYLAVPVISRAGPIGGLFFGHATPGMFSEHDERLAAGIAAQAGIAMDNALLFEQIRREQKLVEESNKALLQANADLEQFAYSASHDLQEPLRMVALYSEMLRRKFGDQLGPDADEYIGYTIEGASRMQRLLADLLSYTRASGLNRAAAATADSQQTLKRALANLQAAVHQSGASVTHTALPPVNMQQVHLEQVFQNLIGNAIKYRGDQPPAIEVRAAWQAGTWLFSVTDNGIGIDPSYREQIFGMFKRLHTAAEYSGSGMGLAICQRIIERYGGRIWVESELGKGSTFFFTIPDSLRQTGSP
ncbi:MAG TPA: ATP-binding protein [Bryobacteraceae bacterium]|nr:ATP-binding protein [Bryobacteraceae bacterium]